MVNYLKLKRFALWKGSRIYRDLLIFRVYAKLRQLRPWSAKFELPTAVGVGISIGGGRVPGAGWWQWGDVGKFVA